MTQIKRSQDKIFDCINEIFNDFNNNKVIDNISEYFERHGTPMSLGAVLKERGTLENISRGEYIWKNGVPDMAMANAVDLALKDRVKTQIAERKVKGKIPVDDIIDDLIVLVDEAVQFGIPQKKIKDYVKTMFHRWQVREV